MRMFFLMVVGFLLNSCISLSMLQTARPVKEGKFVGGVGLGSIGVQVIKKSDDEVLKALSSLRLPVLDFGIRYGLNSKSDVGGSLALIPGSLSTDYKYMLSSPSSNFAQAIGVKIDYSSFELSSGDSHSKFVFTNLLLPLYLSYDFAELSSVYVNPLIGIQSVSVRSNTSSDSSSDMVYGVAFGAAFDWFIAEYAVRSLASSSATLFTDQLTLGVRFPTDNLGRKSASSMSSKNSYDGDESEIETNPGKPSSRTRKTKW